jgi:hypothetical protein
MWVLRANGKTFAANCANGREFFSVLAVAGVSPVFAFDLVY